MESEFPIRQLMQRYLSGQGPEGFINQELIQVLANTFEDEKNFCEATFDKFSMETLLDYVRRTHSYYIFKKLPEIEQTLDILLKDLSVDHPLPVAIHRFYADYQRRLTLHIREEENNLLPYIDHLVAASQNGVQLYQHFKRTRTYSLHQFIAHHHDTEMDIQEVQQLVLKYHPPLTSQTPYRVLLCQLEMLERDLAVHGLVEDHILIPRAMVLEEQLEAALKKNAKLN